MPSLGRVSPVFPHNIYIFICPRAKKCQPLAHKKKKNFLNKLNQNKNSNFFAVGSGVMRAHDRTLQ